MKPLIGITTDIDDGSRFSEKYSGKRIVHLWERYLQAVQDAGGTAILLPLSQDKKDIKLLLGKIDGLLVPGGAFDVPPSYYGEKIIPEAKVKPKEERSKFERELILKAVERGIPILGICGGEQIINVAFGGSLYQDISYQYQTELIHQQKIPSDQVSHPIKIEPKTLLSKLLFSREISESRTLWVNSTHHQAVKTIAQGFKISARASDGIIEAIEAEKGFIIGVQWHPELLYQNHPEQFQLLTGFIEKAKKFSSSRNSN